MFLYRNMLFLVKVQFFEDGRKTGSFYTRMVCWSTLTVLTVMWLKKQFSFQLNCLHLKQLIRSVSS